LIFLDGELIAVGDLFVSDAGAALGGHFVLGK